VDVLARAGTLLAETTVAALPADPGPGPVEVALVGGLVAAGDVLLGPWRAGLPDRVAVVPAEGSSADGALLLAERSDLPHEQHVRRHGVEGRP